MKKIFYILVSAIVALGAVACNNEIEENIEANRSEGVSFTASLDETASRVLIGDLTDGKHPIAFENDDVIWASLEYDYSAPFVFTTTDGVNFTCTEVNANGQLPEELIGKDVFFIVNGQKIVDGQTMNSATGVDGIFFSAEVSNFKNNSTVTLGLQDYYGVFAFTSPYDVTLEASTHIFIIGSNIRNSITIPQAEGTQYVGFMNQMGVEFTLSYSVNGEKVKEITRGYSNKIYTLGGLTEAVATVNGKNYTDLAQAVVAAAEAGADVVLSDDAAVTEPITIPAGTEVTIDLNGNVITADDTTYAFNNLGTLTLKDSNAGAIPSSSSVMSKTGAEIDWSVSARGIYNGYDKDGNYVSTAKLIIESGNYQATGTNGGAAVYNYGILEVKGGYFKSNGGYGLNNQATGVMTIENAEINGGIYNSGGTLTVEEGTKLLQHLSGKHAIYNWAGSVTINGGEFDSLSGNELILADGTNATVTINNGTFKKTAKSWLFGAATGKNISFVINDGKFYGYVNEPEMSVDTIRPYGDPIVVKGGMFNFDPTNWLAEGFQVVANGNGTYTVVKQAYVINQNGEYEISSKEGLMWLADAVNSGNEEIVGKTIILTSDIDLEGENWTPIGFNENGIVESTDKYFTGTFDGKGYTIRNLNIENDNAGGVGLFGAVHDATFKNFTLENVNIKAVDADASTDSSGAQGQANYIVGGHIGAVAAYDAKAGTVTFDNVHLKGLIKIEGETRYAQGQRIAGVFGGKSSSKVVFNDVTVKGDNGSYIKGYCSTAGVVGQHMGVGTFTDVHTDIDVYGVTFGVGGIAGITLKGSTFENCSSAGDLTLDASAVQPASYSGNYFFRVGGIAGCWSESANAELTLTNCSYTGTLKSFNKEGKSPYAFDYDGYVGRGYTLKGCAGSTVIIDGKEFVQVDGNIYGFYMVDGVYEIMDAASLTWFANEVSANKNSFSGKTVKLVNDIDLSTIDNWTPIGIAAADTHFQGTFDGNNKTISGLTIKERSNGKPQAALFGSIAGTVTIKDLTIDGANIVYPQDGADFYGAALVGTYYGNVTVQNVTVQNSYISGNNKVAGILAHDGSSSKLLVDGCKVLNSTIETTDTNDGGNVGGVLGLFQQTTSGVENIIRNTTVKGCTINGINSSDSGKRANGQIVGSVIMKKQDTVLKLQDCTVEGNTFVNGNINYVSPYGDGSLVGGYREGNGYYMGQVYINGVLCEKPVAKVGNVLYTTIDAAIAAANGATITLLADATVNEPCVINENGNTLTLGEFLVKVSNGDGTVTVKDQTYKVYILNDLNYTDVYVYYFGAIANSWPGVKTTNSEIIDGRTYKYHEFKAKEVHGKELGFVFNDGKSSASQVADKKLIMDGDKYVRLSAQGAIDIDPMDVTTFKYSIYVWNQKNTTTKPHIYAFDKTNSDAAIFKTWPGTQLSQTCTYKHNGGDRKYYYIEIPTNVYGRNIGVIASNNGNKQTADLIQTANRDMYIGFWYDSASSYGFWGNGSATFSNPNFN